MTFNDPYSSPASPQAPAGWYPVDGNTQRYWDGYEWTDQLAPLSPGQRLDAGISENDRLYALAMHLGAIFVSFFMPLIMWLIKKDDHPFIDHHGRQAVNFHITIFIALIASFFLILVGIGIFLLPIVLICHFVFPIVAAIRSYKGEYYRIPIAIPFF